MYGEWAKYYRTLRFVRGVGYVWRGVGGVVGVVRVGEWRLGAGSRHAGTGLLDSR